MGIPKRSQLEYCSQRWGLPTDAWWYARCDRRKGVSLVQELHTKASTSMFMYSAPDQFLSPYRTMQSLWPSCLQIGPHRFPSLFLHFQALISYRDATVVINMCGKGNYSNVQGLWLDSRACSWFSCSHSMCCGMRSEESPKNRILSCEKTARSLPKNSCKRQKHWQLSERSKLI